MISLNTIWESSTGLLQRFDLMPSVETAWIKHLEEQGELIEALYILDFKNHRGHFQFRKDVAMEACDCFVTILNTLYAAGFTFNQLGFRNHQLADFWLASDHNHEAIRPALFELQCTAALFHKSIVEMRCFTGDERIDAMARASRSLLPLVRALIDMVKQGGIKFEEFEAAVECVVFKNDKKTDKTHVVIDGFIKKIKQVTP